MAVPLSNFQFENPSTSPSPTNLHDFIITSPPNTDIWRKPGSPSTADVFTAPVFYTALPYDKFRKARVSVSADWKTMYDQGGLVVALPPSSANKQRRWIKTGVEFEDGVPQLSTVVADKWADWSLAPLPHGTRCVTMEIEREKTVQEDGETLGSSLKIFLVEGLSRRVIREITWVFLEENAGDIWVGVYAAKPIVEAGEGNEKAGLDVHFDGLTVEAVE
jgi:uncharacterized protein